jgi:hypothetical protein
MCLLVPRCTAPATNAMSRRQAVLSIMEDTASFPFRPHTATSVVTTHGITDDLPTLVTTVTSGYIPGINATVVCVGTRIVEPISIWWQAKDLSLFEPLLAAALASRLKIDFTESGVMPTPASTQPPLDAPPASSSRLPGQTSLPNLQQVSSFGLNTKTKAGISVSAIVGALIFIIVPLFLYRRHIRKRRKMLIPVLRTETLDPSSLK